MRMSALWGALVLVLLTPQTAAAATDAQVLAAAGSAATWLMEQQATDGSWGASDRDQMLCTSGAVLALRATNLLGPSYLAGIVWLENHRAANSDLSARRFLALAPHLDSLGGDKSFLASAKGPGLALPGWGLSGAYRFDPLDTALVMQALGRGDAAFFSTHLDAIESLAASTWTIAQPSNTPLSLSGDLYTTVEVARTIRTCSALGVPRCVQLFNTLGTVESGLAGYPLGSVFDLALIASYFTPLRDAPPIPVANISGMVDLLMLSQAPNGSWGADVPTTALALRALANWLRLERADASTPIAIADSALRIAVNRSLGHHAMDGVARGDLWRLTTLDLSYAATTVDLSSLADAQNLTTIDISGNPCLLRTVNVQQTLHALFPRLTTIVMRTLGDVNGDGVATTVDLRLLLADLLENSALAGAGARAADLTFDGRLDVRDLFWMESLLEERDVSSLCPQ